MGLVMKISMKWTGILIKNLNERSGGKYENLNEIAQGTIWKTTMKLIDKKMKVVWNQNEIANVISGFLYEMHLWYSPTTYEWPSI